ncbi:helix-turn-helix domain-containing protein [Arcticibacter sp.]|uniref:helix-turn-helix domain-containing protein n=1 Tax=Arcticibacter sp. TaxID=1872630 RepID=UPI00388E3CA3
MKHNLSLGKAESLEDFYQQKFKELPLDIGEKTDHFNVFRLEDCVLKPVTYSRRDFYKISLIRGRNRYHYAEKSLEIDGPTLMFFNPSVPYTWEPLCNEATGFFCIFSKSFFTGKVAGGLTDLPMYACGGRPAYRLDERQDEQVSGIFHKMLEEIKSDYVFKYDLLRNYVAELTHVALKSTPSESVYEHPNAKSRITAVFTELLERQFPIESPSARFNMRSAKDFANQLAIHVNHLNRAVKETTGKTTTSIIAERMLTEARILLKRTNWNISEISYCLGFEEPSHFNNFFKKQTQLTPSRYRTT